MITLQQASYTLAKANPTCGFTVQMPQGVSFEWSHILWNEDNNIPLPSESDTETLWNSTYKAEWDAEDAAVTQKATDKVNAKTKLMAGEALTEAEADTIVL